MTTKRLGSTPSNVQRAAQCLSREGQGDTSLKEKLNAPTTPEAAIEIAKEAGFSITAEDIQSMQSQSGEVSDDELEGATGGLVEVTLASPTTPTTSPTVITRVTHNRSRLTPRAPSAPAPAPIIK